MTRLVKVAYLTSEYPRASDTFIQREVAALREIGHEVITCSIRSTGPEHLVGPEQLAEHATTFKVLEAAKRPWVLIRAHLRWMKRPGRYLSALRLAWLTSQKGMRGRLYQLFYFAEAGLLAKHLEDQGAEHLHNHIAMSSCTVAMLVNALSGLPYSFTIHGPHIFFEPKQWRIDEKAARARFVACISDYCRSQLMCFSDEAHWPRFHIVHCGIDPARYTEPPAHEGKHLLFVGRLARVKGVPMLLDTLPRLIARHPDLRVTLIGDGPDRAALERRVAAENLTDFVSFFGYRSQDEVAAELAGADIFVLPSFAEGLPVVLMEAMAAQVPVVTTHIAGIPELVEDGKSGWLVPPGDADRLSEALEAALGDAETRRIMGRAGRARVVAEHDIRKEAAWFSRIIEGYAVGDEPRAKRPGART